MNKYIYHSFYFLDYLALIKFEIFGKNKCQIKVLASKNRFYIKNKPKLIIICYRLFFFSEKKVVCQLKQNVNKSKVFILLNM